MLKANGVPATTLTERVGCNGSETLVPKERPQVVGLPKAPAGETGRFDGQTRLTGPLKVLSGVICN